MRSDYRVFNAYLLCGVWKQCVQSTSSAEIRIFIFEIEFSDNSHVVFCFFDMDSYIYSLDYHCNLDLPDH